jgi:hypothetical protein
MVYVSFYLVTLKLLTVEIFDTFVDFSETSKQLLEEKNIELEEGQFTLRELAYQRCPGKSAVISLEVKDDFILCTEFKGSLSVMKYDPNESKLHIVATVHIVQYTL